MGAVRGARDEGQARGGVAGGAPLFTVSLRSDRPRSAGRDAASHRRYNHLATAEGSIMLEKQREVRPPPLNGDFAWVPCTAPLRRLTPDQREAFNALGFIK